VKLVTMDRLLTGSESADIIRLPALVNLRDMSDSEQHAYLQAERERAVLDSGAAAMMADTVYLLRGRFFEELVPQMRQLEMGADDIDGTVTGVGENRIYDAAIAALRGLEQTGMHNVGVTGRHDGQIEGMYAAHNGDLPYGTFLIEQGGGIKQGRNASTPYLGTQELVNQMADLRASMEPFLQATAETNGVDFIPTSGGGHRMMVSFDALQRGTQDKITNGDQHARIFDAFQGYWGGRIAAALALKTGSSSTGTFEVSDPTIHKARALRSYAQSRGVPLSRVAFSGDSGNDAEGFEEQDPVKIVVVNSHTGLNLTRNAHFATVGTGNAGPAKKLIEAVRRLG